MCRRDIVLNHFERIGMVFSIFQIYHSSVHLKTNNENYLYPKCKFFDIRIRIYDAEEIFVLENTYSIKNCSNVPINY